LRRRGKTVKVEVAYQIGSSPTNEDAFVLNEANNIFSVIDGATGLGGLPGKIAAETIADALNNYTSHETLMGCIKKGNNDLRIKMNKEFGTSSIERIPKEARSTCGIAAIKINKKNLEYVHAGDCMIFIKYQGGEIRAVTYEHLLKIDRVAIELMHRIIIDHYKQGKVPNEESEEEVKMFLNTIRAEILPTLIENRRKLNTINGYSVIDGSPEAMDYLECGRVSLQNIDKILLLTDGLQLPSQSPTVGHSIWNESAKYAFDHGIDALKNYIIQLEQSDNICNKYPRLKPADDKTGILIKL
jgi:serine/threonine protein phosphatase PrpC